MFGRFFGARYYGPRYWGDGGDVVVVVAETPSGGWARGKGAFWRGETDSAREARIKAERVKLGIIEPDPPETTEGEAAGATIEGVPATLVSPEAPDYDQAAALAEMYTSAWLDQEIARFFREQDDDDAAVLLLAIAATIH